jgi:O-antigen/teichoic acid export membrane protein
MPLKLPKSARSLLVFGTKIGGAGLAFLLNIAITRAVGIHDAGVFFVSLSLVTILYAVARFGLGYTTYRFIAELDARRREDLRSLTASVVALVAFSSTLIGVALSAGSEWVSAQLFEFNEGAFVVALLAWTIPIYCTGSILSEVLKGLRKPLQYALFENVLIKACALLGVVSLGHWWGLQGTSWAFLGANIVALVTVTILCLRALSEQPASSRRFYPFSEVLKTTSMFAVVSISTVLAQWLGPLIVGYLLSPADAAIFFTAYRTSVVLEFVVISIVSVTGPALVAAYTTSGITAVTKLARPEALKALVGASCLAVPALVLAPRIMGLYGSEFAIGENVLRILIVAQVINAPLGVFNAAMIALKKERHMAALAPLSAMGAAVLSGVFTLLWGLPGAAVGVGISTVLYNITIYVVLRRISALGLATDNTRIERI